jgi:hypothetical protein
MNAEPPNEDYDDENYLSLSYLYRVLYQTHKERTNDRQPV